MMKWRFIKLGSSVALVFLLIGCVQSEYTRLVNQELARGVRYDSVLLGIRFGDTQQVFRDKCFALNRQHLAIEGDSFWVRYLFPDSSKDNSPKMKLLFLPTFDEKNTVAGLDLKFSYAGWAPWNAELQSGHLEEKIKPLLMKWYGGNEFVLAHVGGKDIPVKVDGNRRIMIYNAPPEHVVVRVQDILHPMFRHNKDKNVSSPQ